MENTNADTPNQGTFSKISRWLKESIIVKLMAIGVLILILLIPNAMISSLIFERQNRQSEVEREVNQCWGGEQSFVGPVLTIPYISWVEYENGNSEKLRINTPCSFEI